MAGDLVLIVLKVKLIVIGQLEKEEGKINASTHRGSGGGQRSDLRAVVLELGSGEGQRRRSYFDTQEASSHLLSFGDSPAGDDDDFILLVKCHNFRHTVRRTGMVNVPGQWDTVRNARQLSWDDFGSLVGPPPEGHPQGPQIPPSSFPSHLAGPPVKVASITCSLFIRNM